MAVTLVVAITLNCFHCQQCKMLTQLFLSVSLPSISVTFGRDAEIAMMHKRAEMHKMLNKGDTVGSTGFEDSRIAPVHQRFKVTANFSLA
jgi:hypothetical protein